MSLSLEQLREEMLALPLDQQRDLADSIYENLECSEFALHPDWLPELDRRAEELRSGKVAGIPAEDVFRELEAIIHKS